MYSNQFIFTSSPKADLYYNSRTVEKITSKELKNELKANIPNE